MKICDPLELGQLQVTAVVATELEMRLGTGIEEEEGQMNICSQHTASLAGVQ